MCWLSLAIGLNAETDTRPLAVRQRQIQVVDAENRPVAGAAIEGETFYPWGPATAANARAEWHGVTDAQGRASFTIKDGQSITFVARKTGFSVGWLGWIRWDAQSGESEGIDWIDLTAPAAVSGTVKDAGGRPVADAVVWVLFMRLPDKHGAKDSFRYLGAQLGRKYLTTRTGAEGQFQIDGLPQDATLELAVDKPGLALEARSRNFENLPYRAGQTGIPLALVPAAGIEGRVVDETTGAPIAGARVIPSGSIGVEVMKEFPPTGADGLFRLTNLGPGRVQLSTLFGTNAIPDWIFEPVSLVLEAGAIQREVKVNANPGGIVEVVVRTDPGDEPLAEVNVFCFGKRRSGDVPTTAAGLARFRLPAGRYDVGGTKPGWTITRAPVYCELGKTNRVTLKASPAPRFSGLVQDTAGKPATNLAVSLIPRQQLEEVRTDHTGRFSLINNPPRPGNGPRQKLFLLARDPARNLAAAPEIGDDPTNANAVIVLQPGVTLTGSVTDEQGKGISNALARLTWRTHSFDADLNIEAATDAGGRFEIKGLPVGWRYRLDVSAAGYGNRDRNLDAPEADPHHLEAEPIELVKADRSVAGIVLDEADKPAVDAWVSMGGIGQPNGSTRTDEKGRFSFAQACAGAVHLSAQAGDTNGITVVEAGDTNAVIRLGERHEGVVSGSAPSRRFFGTILDPEGKPAPNLRVEQFPSWSGAQQDPITDAQGRFKLVLNLDANAMRRIQYLLVALDPARNLAATLDLDEDATNAILRLEPTWTWVGRATNASGAGISNAVAQRLIRGRDYARRLDAPVRADPHGRFEVKGLPRGRSFMMRITAPGYGPSSCLADAPDNGKDRGESAAVLLPTADLALGGVVLDGKDRPLEGVSITSSEEHQPNTTCQTDRQGRFFFKEMCPGPVQLSANGPDGQFASVTTEGGETNLVIRFGDPGMRKDGTPLPKIAGIVVDTDGKPARGIRVVLLPVNQYGHKTDAQGRFKLTLETEAFGMEINEFTLFALDPVRHLAASLDVTEGGTNAQLQLEPAWTLAGRVTDPGGAGIAQALVQAKFRTAGFLTPFGQPVRTDAAGRFEMPGLAPGRSFVLDVSAKGYGSTNATVEAPPDHRQRVEMAPIPIPAANQILAGVVLDENEQPVKGAALDYSSEGQSQGHGQTDNKGRFLIKGVCPGPVHISARDSKGGYGGVATQGGDTNIVVQFGARWRNPEIMGRPSLKIPGVVVDAEGKPAPNIRLLVLPNDSGRKTSDAEGRFSLVLDPMAGLWGTKQFEIWALDPTRAWATSLDVDEETTNANLRLEPAWTLAGRVIDDGGAALTNARAELVFQGVPLPAPYGAPIVTDREGRFEIKGLPPGRAFGVNISAKGYSRAQLRVALPDAGTNRVEVDPVRLIAANRVVGGVVLDDKDQPVNGASVQCSDAGLTGNERRSDGTWITVSASPLPGAEPPGAGQRSDGQGRFLIKGICPGRVNVSANDAKGRFAWAFAEAGDTNVVLRLTDPRRNLAVNAAPRPRITGTVVDADGKPARAVRLVFPPFSHIQKRTDAEGRFSLNPNAEGIGGTGTRLVVLALDTVRNLAASAQLDEEATNTNLRLEPAWTLSGRVTDVNAAPVTNAQAELLFRGEGMAAAFGPPLTVDAEGRFAFKTLPPGHPFEVSVSAKGYGRARLLVDAPEEGKDRVETDPLQLSAANLTLGGVVWDDKDHPVRGVVVQCYGEGREANQRVTDRQGRFRFKGVCPGRVQVSANDFGGRYAAIESEGGATNVVLRLAGSRPSTPPNARLWPKLNGTVVDPDGQPARHLRVTFPPFTHIEKTTDTAGRFAWDPNQEGWGMARNQIVAMATDPGRNLAASLDLNDQTTNANLKLEPAWTWLGRVTDANGAAVTNAQAQLMFRSAIHTNAADLTNAVAVTNALGQVVTPPTSMVVPIGTPVAVDGAGRFTFKGLPQGRAFEVGVSAKGYGRAEQKVEAPKAGQNQLETNPIPLPAANLTLAGVVVDDQDRPVRGARVQFHSERQSGSHRTTDRQGRFLFKDACPGRLEVTANDFRSRSGTVAAAGGDTNLTVRIKSPERRPVPIGAGLR